MNADDFRDFMLAHQCRKEEDAGLPETAEVEIDLSANHQQLLEIENSIHDATTKHNAFLRELGLPELPCAKSEK